MADKQITINSFRCKSCHQKTYMEVVGRMDDSSEEMLGSPDFIGWLALLCPNCEQINIWRGWEIWDEESSQNGEIIYPPSISYKAPDHIDLQFRAAVEAMHSSPAGAANQFRVILEMIWEDHGPIIGPKQKKPGNLRNNNKNKGMLQDLFDAGVLSGDYFEMADMLAIVGNKGSHDDPDITVESKDAIIAMKLTTAILEHVYHVRLQGIDYLEELRPKFANTSASSSNHNYWYSKSSSKVK